jgi:hypothetical protein
MQIPIVNGIYADETPALRDWYPRNMVPISKNSGVSTGFLRPHEGITAYGTGPGLDRGGICWNGTCHRVMGSKLVSIPVGGGVAVVIGDVGGSTSQVTIDYSFDYLAIASDGGLWLYNGAALTQNTDPDLGTCLDIIYIDGYFVSTDGQFIVVTDLGNPFSVNPLKYGSSEVDPDPVVGLIKVNNELYAVNRHTIEVFQNVGGSLFPFVRVEGTRVDRGAIGTHAFCLFMQQIAFVGSARGEAPGVYIALNAGSTKISTREIDTILEDYSEAQLSQTVCEVRVTRRQQLLYIHLPDQTLVFDGESSQEVGLPVWYRLTSSLKGNSKFRAKNFVWSDKKWICGDTLDGSTNYGYLDDTISEHFGQTIGWEFNTNIVYNESFGAIFHELELVSLPGRVSLGADPVVWTSYSLDGALWSQEKKISAGKQGERNKRLVWLAQGAMKNYRIQKFRGTSDAHIAIARLEARMEALAY